MRTGIPAVMPILIVSCQNQRKRGDVIIIVAGTAGSDSIEEIRQLSGQASTVQASTLAEAIEIASQHAPTLAPIATYARDAAELRTIMELFRGSEEPCVVVSVGESAPVGRLGCACWGAEVETASLPNTIN